MTTTNRTLPSARHQQQWSNWGGNQVCTPALTVRPTTEAEAVGAVRYAVTEGMGVRVAGAGHSFTPVVQTGGMLLDLSGLQGITGIDSATGRVRALGGTTIDKFGDPLWERGLSLANQGDIDKQAIAGAVSTATHGSGIGLGSFASTVRWMRLLTGQGEIIEVDETDPERLHAVQVAVGTAGVILELELQAVEAYHLREQITYETTEELLENWERNPLEARHFSFLWCQAPESAGLYELPTPDGLDMVGRAYTKRYWAESLDESDGRALSSEEGRRRDRAYRIYPGGFMLPFHELEYYVGVDRAKEAWTALKDLILEDFPDQHYPIETRWTRGDEAFLSPFYHEDKVSLSVSGAPGTDYWPYLQAVDSLLDGFDATVHWGKIHLLTRERAERLFPRLPDFLRVRRELDPRGVFLNDHTRALFH